MPRNTLPRRLLCAAILAALGIHPAVAAKPGDSPKGHQPVCPSSPALPAPESRLPEIAADDDRIHVEADRIEARLNEAATFTGHVELRRGNLHLFADELHYDQAENHIDAQGSIHLRREDGSAIMTPRLQYAIDPGLGSAEDAQFDLPEGGGRGYADNIRFEAKDVLKFDSVRYTTCPPQRNDWFLHASHLTLDKAAATGTGTNVWFTFMHVPVFYTPYLSFPLTDERRTGLLAPLLGHNTRTGFLVATPYYINLAPNMDDTLTPRFLSERGVQTTNEFRYLGESYKGQIDVSYLPNDRQTGTDRDWLRVRHEQNLSPQWSIASNAQWVSDNNYFIDFGAASADSGITHLPRDLHIDYGDGLWRFRARASSFQTLDTTITPSSGFLPYQRLPQLLLSADSSGSPNTLHAGFEGEWVSFYRPVSVTGQRLDLMPSLSLPLRTSYFYFTPKAALRYTAWRLDNASGMDATGTIDPLRSPDPERLLPLYSVDTGLALEREGDWFGSSYIQTLEPRLYYVRIPYRDQDDLPVFDTAIPDFNFLNFFRENRFVGADRVGDTNQVTAAITSRFIQPASGIEQARVSLGQVRYYEDQRVNLPPATASLTSSDLIGEVGAQFGQAWYLRSGMQWDNKVGETRKGVLYLHYRPDPDRIVNLGYRYLNPQTFPPSPDEQYDVSSQWLIGPRWKVFGRWNYSITQQQIVQTYAGVERNSCCWSARLTLRQRLLPDGTEDHGVLFEFGLGGFSELGQGEENPLKQGKFIFE